jgi:hypothetical protein
VRREKAWARTLDVPPCSAVGTVPEGLNKLAVNLSSRSRDNRDNLDGAGLAGLVHQHGIVPPFQK